MLKTSLNVIWGFRTIQHSHNVLSGERSEVWEKQSEMKELNLYCNVATKIMFFKYVFTDLAFRSTQQVIIQDIDSCSIPACTKIYDNLMLWILLHEKNIIKHDVKCITCVHVWTLCSREFKTLKLLMNMTHCSVIGFECWGCPDVHPQKYAKTSGGAQGWC